MGQVCMTHQLLGSLYELTEQGRYMLDNFDTRVPASRREAIETAARRWKPRFRAEQQNQADAFPMKDDRQCLRLRMLEGDSALLDMSLTVTKHITEGQLRELLMQLVNVYRVCLRPRCFSRSAKRTGCFP